MAISNKIAGLMLLAGQAAGLSAFPVEHRHLNGNCAGDLEVSATGVAYTGPKEHAWHWDLEDIRELKIAPDHVYVLSYHGSYDFRGKVPVDRLYRLLKDVMDQRLVIESGQAAGPSYWTVPVKRRGGADGSLTFGSEAIVYSSDKPDESRTWRYKDIDNISTSGPLQFTITTFERALANYTDRKDFSFELKQPITESKYNELWLLVEKENGRIP